MNRDDNKYGKASAIVGMVMAIGFIIFWIGSATMIGAPFIFPLFGIGMLVMVVLRFIGGMKAYKAQEERRNKSEEKRYEEDLLREVQREYSTYTETKDKQGFCPFCGAKVERNFNYCPKCGNHIQ